MNHLQRMLCANRGTPLEKAIIASQRNAVHLEKHETCGRWIKGKFVPIKGPVDFIGQVVATGRAIHFDAKRCELKGRFPVGNEDHFPEHQRNWLIRNGATNAIAGLLIEATHASLEKYFWLSWKHLIRREPSIQWDDSRLLDLGSTKLYFDFQKIIAAELLEKRA